MKADAIAKRYHARRTKANQAHKAATVKASDLYVGAMQAADKQLLKELAAARLERRKARGAP